MKKCSGCGSEFDDTSRYCPYCGTEYGEEENRTGAAEEYEWQPEKKERTINTGQGMIWHRVLLLFLIVNAIWSIISGLGYMNRYRNPEWIVYAGLPVASDILRAAFPVGARSSISALGLTRN